MGWRFDILLAALILAIFVVSEAVQVIGKERKGKGYKGEDGVDSRIT